MDFGEYVEEVGALVTAALAKLGVDARFVGVEHGMHDGREVVFDVDGDELRVCVRQFWKERSYWIKTSSVADAVTKQIGSLTEHETRMVETPGVRVRDTTKPPHGAKKLAELVKQFRSVVDETVSEVRKSRSVTEPIAAWIAAMENDGALNVSVDDSSPRYVTIRLSSDSLDIWNLVTLFEAGRFRFRNWSGSTSELLAIAEFLNRTYQLSGM